MGPGSKSLVRIAGMLQRRGLVLSRVMVGTPDGRSWALDAAPKGGFRLFELDPDGRGDPDEHHAVEGETWEAGELADYLGAVGAKRG